MLCLMLAAIEVVSFNIRYDNPADGPNGWNHRQQTVSSYLKQSKADFIGLQEVLPSQLAELKPRLSDYNVISRTREADEGKGERAPLFFTRSGGGWTMPTKARCGFQPSRTSQVQRVGTAAFPEFAPGADSSGWGMGNPKRFGS